MCYRVKHIRFISPPPSLSLQIFFHYSELSQGAESEMAMGACVEFVIQSRQVHTLYWCVCVCTISNVRLPDIKAGVNSEGGRLACLVVTNHWYF